MGERYLFVFLENVVVAVLGDDEIVYFIYRIIAIGMSPSKISTHSNK